MTMIFVTPAALARVRMPERGSAVMTAAGAWVPRNVHYEQLLQNRDVVLADPQPDLPKPKAAAQAGPEPAAPAADAMERIAPPTAERSSSHHRTPAQRAVASKEK